MTKYILDNKSTTLLRIYVQPGAKSSEFFGTYGEPPRLKIRVRARPEDGEANKEVIEFLSKQLKISKSLIEIKSGHTSRQKDILLGKSYEEIILVFRQLGL